MAQTKDALRILQKVTGNNEAVKAGIAQARAKGITFGRPKSVAKKTAEIRRLYRKEKLSKSEIARRLGIGRTSVRRLLENS